MQIFSYKWKYVLISTGVFFSISDLLDAFNE
jgi:hypothetical protein